MPKVEMTHSQAIERVAAKMALNTFMGNAQASLIPNLSQTVRENAENNEAACDALGCGNQYRANLSILENS